MIPHYDICLKMLRPFTKWGDKPRRKNSINCNLGTESKYSYVDEWPRAWGTKCLNLPKENPEAKVFANYIQSVVTHMGLWTNEFYPKPPARYGGVNRSPPFCRIHKWHVLCFWFCCHSERQDQNLSCVSLTWLHYRTASGWCSFIGLCIHPYFPSI